MISKLQWMTFSRNSGSLRRFIPTEKPVLRLLLKCSRAARQRGEIETARRYATLATRIHPRDRGATLHLVRVLSDPPVLHENLERSSRIIAQEHNEDPTDPAVLKLFIQTLFSRLDAGATTDDLDPWIRQLMESPEVLVVPRLRPEIKRRVDFGDCVGPTRLAHAVYEAACTRQYGLLAHATAVMAGEAASANSVARDLRAGGQTTVEDDAFMANEVSLLNASGAGVIEGLLTLRPQREPRYSMQLIRALRSVGAEDEVLSYLDSTAHGLTRLTESAHRFKALVAVGKLEEAHELALCTATEYPTDVLAFRHLCASYKHQGVEGDSLLTERIRVLEHEFTESSELGKTDQRKQSILTALYFEIGMFADVRRIADTADEISPPIRRRLARIAYIERDFPASLTNLGQLSRSDSSWDAEKLRGRVLLEKGDFAGALAGRRSTPQINGEHDEVLYHALLNNQDYAQAFAVFTTERDHRRIKTVFGTRWEDGSSLTRVKRRLVVSQAGPGDEIMLASTYSLLSSLSEHLAITCDPRLYTILSRSFPDIYFVPVDRLAASQPGFVTNGATRPRNALYDLLTLDAFHEGLSSDRVVLSKALGQLKFTQVGTRAASPYLIPDQLVTKNFRSRWGIKNPIGIVWRSENRSPQRDIHYLTVDDLAPLLAENLTFVSLQYDATPDERRRLVELCGDRISFMDDVDLRNDLDSTAAIVKSLAATVGIGTTTIELSGAVGTATMMIQPTHFGTWRAIDESGHDFWHESVSVSRLTEPWNRPQLVEQARLRLLSMLHD